MDGIITMDDIEILAEYHEIGKPPIFGRKSDPGKDIWLGTEIGQILNETSHLGPCVL